MKLLTLLTLGFLAIHSTSVQATDLNALEAETLLDQKVTIPKVFGQRPALLIIGFTKASQKAISQCAERSEELFPNQTYSAAVLQGAPFFLKGIIKNGIRSTVPEKRRDRFLILHDGKEELKRLSGYTEESPDDAYWLEFVPQSDGQHTTSAIGHGICDVNQIGLIKSKFRSSGHSNLDRKDP